MHYRVGNLGGGDLADAGGRATVYVVGRRVFERTGWVPGSGERWEGGVSYHSGAETATATSVAVPELHPLTATFNVPGPAWLFTAVLVWDEDDEEIGWHGVWQNLTALSGPTFDAVRVRVDRDDYWVATETDDEGIVRIIAAPAKWPVYEVQGPARAKAIYTAGTRALTLGSILDRPAIAALSEDLLAREGLEPEPVPIQNPSSTALIGGLAAQASCDGAPTLGDALEAIGAEDIDATLALDARLRETLPVHGLATDAALCAIAGIDDSNAAFLRSLGIERSEVAALVAPALPPVPEPVAVPEPKPEPVQLRVIARLAEDGRIEHGVELATGQQILPERRYFAADADDRRWFETTDIEVGGGSIGIVRARWAGDGRIEFGFVDASGNTIAPEQRYLPAELPPGEWLRSSEFEVPPPAPPELPDH